MKPRLLLGPSTAALGESLDRESVAWPLTVLDWSRDDASALLEETLLAGHALLALAHDEDAMLEALAQGATEALALPASEAHVRARLRRAERIVRQPWLERVLELTDDSIELADTGARFLDVSPGFERVTGYARADVLGKTPGSLFRVETADPSYYAQIDEGLAREGVWRGQLTAVRHDRSISFVQATVSTVRDERGRTIGHLAVKRDASRDGIAASALGSAEARTRTLMDRAAEALVLHSLDGRVIEVNSATCRMLGATRAELLARNAASFEVASAAQEQALREAWASLGDTPAKRETEWRRADGTIIPIELSAGRVELVGNPFVFAVARDITERRRAEAELRALNARLESLNESLEDQVATRTQELRESLAHHAALVDAVAEGILAVGADHRVNHANPAAARMLDARIEEGALLESLHPALARLADECMHRGVERSTDVPLAGQRSAAARAAPIVVERADGSAATTGCVILVRDVTREREVDRMKTDFIATVSHELRTPLTSVLGFAKLARSKLDLLLPLVPPDDARLARAAQQVTGNLEIISSEGKRLGDLINDVLDISKMEAGRVDWREDVLRPAELVERAVTATSGLFEGSLVERAIDVEDDLPLLVGDEPRLLQVLINLVSNAAKFTAAGRITVAARKVSDGVELSVADTGPGIPASEHALIFERFRQSSSDTLTDKPRGTGLGLTISKHIVEHHGGRIWVESKLGEGSRFAFVVPLRKTLPSTVPPSDAALSGLVSRIASLFPAGEEKRGADILVVDDDDSARELLVQVLGDAGHQIRTARDGVQAVAEVRRRRPDLLVLDVLMPGLTGFDVAALVRADPETHEVPILIISVLTDPERGVRLGVDRYLSKPVEGPRLLDAVESLLRRSDVPRRVLVVDPVPEHAAKVRAALESDRCVVVGTSSVEDALPRARELAPDLVVVGVDAVGLVDALRDDAALQHVAVIALVEP